MSTKGHHETIHLPPKLVAEHLEGHFEGLFLGKDAFSRAQPRLEISILGKDFLKRKTIATSPKASLKIHNQRSGLIGV